LDDDLPNNKPDLALNPPKNVTAPSPSNHLAGGAKGLDIRQENSQTSNQ